MRTTTLSVLTPSQADFFWEHGFLHVPGIFDDAETDELAAHLDILIERWSRRFPGWVGDWRRALMDADTERRSELVALHDLQLYSAPWARAIIASRMAAVAADLLGGVAEFHHSTMHTKPPETGMPFPMHQDHPFMPHADGRFLSALVHLDDTSHGNGEIRFLDGSHHGGPLDHITVSADGSPATPHLPMERYRLAESVPVPAARGDIVCFNINTVHGSYINTTDRPRRLVRVGYRHPQNTQIGGQSCGRPGMMVAGFRERASGQEPFPTE